MLMVAALLIAVAIKEVMSHRESEWRGLSESEARSGLDERLPSRIPDDKRAAISDKVVDKMRDRGVIRQDPDEMMDLTGTGPEPAETADV